MPVLVVQFELLIWDNRLEQKGLCEVYNKLAATAQFEYIVFLHEDITIETGNWGQHLISIFESKPNAGAVGVAGSKYKSAAFSGWFTGVKEFDCCNILHRYSYGDELLLMKPDETKILEDVICLDGVFICCRKKSFESVKFDEVNLKGFHFYDIDFSLRLAQRETVLVTYKIDLIHITTGGDFGDSWVKTAIDYHRFARDMLPHTNLSSLPPEVDKKIAIVWLDVLKNYSISWSNKWRWVWYQKLWRQPSLYYSILKFLVYKPFGLRYLHRKIKKSR